MLRRKISVLLGNEHRPVVLPYSPVLLQFTALVPEEKNLKMTYEGTTPVEKT